MKSVHVRVLRLLPIPPCLPPLVPSDSPELRPSRPSLACIFYSASHETLGAGPDLHGSLGRASVRMSIRGRVLRMGRTILSVLGCLTEVLGRHNRERENFPGERSQNRSTYFAETLDCLPALCCLLLFVRFSFHRGPSTSSFTNCLLGSSKLRPQATSCVALRRESARCVIRQGHREGG